MAVEHTAGGTMVSGHEDVLMYRYMMIRRALAFEVKTGMKMYRGSVLRAAQDAGLTNKRTKLGALREIDANFVDAGMDSVLDSEGNPR